MASEKKPASKTSEQTKLWAQVVARAWSDEAFKARLLADPAAVLKEAGMEVPEGVQFKVVETSARVVPLILPASPESGELSEEQLAAVSGGISTMPCICREICATNISCGD
jgi:hypothetical protein